ncbi:MAG: nitrous oxide reductase accessory protein NosL [Acidobacteriota bacterium]
MKRTIRLLSICTLSIALLPLICSASPAEEKKPVEVKKGDKCQVCGMFVSGYPTWVAEIIFNDGTYAVFDGPKDMFRYYFNVAKYNPGKKQSDINAIYVTEYYSAKFMDARKGIFFVQGSDVNGPMGAELVPVDSFDRAKGFMKDHRGKKILKFGEVKKEDLR